MRASPKNVIVFLLLCACQSVYSQYILKGRVVDKKTKLPLAFVTILVNNDQQKGITSDIDGRFSFSSREKIKSVTCSYISYKNLNLKIDTSEAVQNLLLQMESIDIPLKEVEIHAGENPANRIIRLAVKNKSRNDPENISAFRYTCYNKMTYDLVSNDTTRNDSAQKEIDKDLLGGHLMLMESVTERKYKRPDFSEEVVVATKVSGFKHPTFAALATGMQPFSFYKDLITLFEVNYLNPISKGSTNRYFFELKDTLYQGKDSVFVIAYRPKKGRNFDGLKGLLYINTHFYAVQNVIAEPYEKGPIGLQIQQKYVLLQDTQWFPEQLNYELSIQSADNQRSLVGNGRSYIRDVQLYDTLRRRDFSGISVRMKEDASVKDSMFWSKHRPFDLDKRELITYHVIDSIGKENKFDRLQFILENGLRGRIPVSFVDVDITRLFINNRLEGWRPGIGLYTNDRLVRNLSVGGFAGYGLKDYQWKYGGECVYTINKLKEVSVKAGYQNNFQEAGLRSFGIFNQISALSYRSFLAYRMDKLEKKYLSVSFRAIKYAKINFTLSSTRVSPQYAYDFIGDGAHYLNYINSSATLYLRYAYKEKLVESFRQLNSLGTKFPVLYLVYSKGFKNIYGGNFDYNKVELAIEKSFLSKDIGRTDIRLEAGYVDSPLPYGLLFTGEGARDKRFPVVMPRYFQTMDIYEFLSDRYATLFFSHDFSSLLFKADDFRPAVRIIQNISVGMLSEANRHQLISFTTQEKGYFESGLQLDNLRRIKSNGYYLGIGIGIYYRYGAYALPEMKDNFIYKISTTITTK